jgi:hypothetical protein
MKRPVFEQEQARKVETSFRILQHAQKISHNVSQTCRFFGKACGVQPKIAIISCESLVRSQSLGVCRRDSA